MAKLSLLECKLIDSKEVYSLILQQQCVMTIKCLKYLLHKDIR
jgi:hypothetical protein